MSAETIIWNRKDRYADKKAHRLLAVVDGHAIAKCGYHFEPDAVDEGEPSHDERCGRCWRDY